MTTPTLQMFYDGLCPLCSREIAHYRKCAAGDPSIEFVDITSPDFKAGAFGLDPARVHREMHVKMGDELHVGVNAFLAIWQRMPGFRWMARLGRLPGMYHLLCVGYAVFAWIRPMLPRRKASCETGTCSR